MENVILFYEQPTVSALTATSVTNNATCASMQGQTHPQHPNTVYPPNLPTNVSTFRLSRCLQPPPAPQAPKRFRILIRISRGNLSAMIKSLALPWEVTAKHLKHCSVLKRLTTLEKEVVVMAVPRGLQLESRLLHICDAKKWNPSKKVVWYSKLFDISVCFSQSASITLPIKLEWHFDIKPLLEIKLLQIFFLLYSEKLTQI